MDNSQTLNASWNNLRMSRFHISHPKVIWHFSSKSSWGTVMIVVRKEFICEGRIVKVRLMAKIEFQFKKLIEWIKKICAWMLRKNKWILDLLLSRNKIWIERENFNINCNNFVTAFMPYVISKRFWRNTLIEKKGKLLFLTL